MQRVLAAALAVVAQLVKITDRAKASWMGLAAAVVFCLALAAMAADGVNLTLVVTAAQLAASAQTVKLSMALRMAAVVAADGALLVDRLVLALQVVRAAQLSLARRSS